MLKHLVACLTTLLIITGCKKNKQEEATLRVVTSADQPPFEFFNPASGNVEGFDIDLATEIGRRLKMEVTIVDMDFGGVLPSLQSGQADMAIAGITRTPEREKTIDFTNDYYQPKIGILSLNETRVEGLRDLKERKVGVQLGTYHQMLLEAVAKQEMPLDVVARNRLLDLVQELLSQNIHAVMMDYIPALKFVASNKGKLSVVEFQHPKAQAYAIALPKNSPLKNKLNVIIQQLIDEGFIQQLEQKWLTEESEPVSQ